MTTRLVRIGNSRGIRIPRAFLEHCRAGDRVKLEMRRRELVIRPRLVRKMGRLETDVQTQVLDVLARIFAAGVAADKTNGGKR